MNEEIENEIYNLGLAITRSEEIEKKIRNLSNDVEILEREQELLLLRIGEDLYKALEDRACELIENGGKTTKTKTKKDEACFPEV